MINSSRLLNELLESTADEISLSVLTPYIIKGIETKMNVVLQDEHESGVRKFLNLGHTLGHAIEYRYKIPHGQAVMLGIIGSLFISNELNRTNFDIDFYEVYMTKHGYPVELLKQMDVKEMTD